MNSKLAIAVFSVLATTAYGTNIGDLSDCTTGTLAYYQSNFNFGNGAGCKIGNLGYSRFYFDEFAPTAGALDTGNITAANLLVVPNVATNSFSLLPYNPATQLVDLSYFNRTITAAERYYISYYVDPPPIIAGDELRLDPPVGNIFATKWGCADSEFAPLGTTIENRLLTTGRANYSTSTFRCGPNNADPYLLKANGTGANFEFVNASIQFAEPVAELNIRLVLDFEEGTIRGFEGIDNPVRTTIPEPAANLLIAGGLAMMALVARRRSIR